MSLDAMKQALSAIEFADMYIKEIVTGSTNRIVAENLLRESGKSLRAAIEQEPWVKTYTGGQPNYTTPEEKQEPVAWMTFNAVGDEDDIWYVNPDGKLLEGWTYKPLYTAPRQWQGLTDEDREEILRWVEWKEIGSQPVAPQKLIAYVERKLREKNT